MLCDSSAAPTEGSVFVLGSTSSCWRRQMKTNVCLSLLYRGATRVHDDCFNIADNACCDVISDTLLCCMHYHDPGLSHTPRLPWQQALGGNKHSKNTTSFHGFPDVCLPDSGDNLLSCFICQCLWLNMTC